MMLEDDIAQKLEAAGLWRRAASRWLDVMLPHGLTDQQRDRIRQHRKHCFSYSKSIKSPEKLDVTEIARAVKASQERMGLLQVESQRKNNRLAVYNGRLPVDDELIFGHDHIGKYMFISLDCIDIKSESAGKVS